jgi:periplasmic protein TonB
MRFWILFLFIHCSVALNAQYYPLPVAEKESPYDTAAVFPGGSTAMYKFFSDHTIYPQQEYSNRKSGSVLLSFQIDSIGRVGEIHIINGVAGAPNFVKEAARVVGMMPLWKPAIKSGRYVSSRYTISFPFNLKKAHLKHEPK